MPNLFESIGLKVNYYPPLAKAGVIAKIGALTNEIASYSHETTCRDGFLSAEIGCTMGIKLAEEWYTNGLGRQIKTLARNGRIFEGFVNQLQVNAGSVTETRGPLLDIGNRVSAVYTPMDFSDYPPVAGTETTTIIVEDLLSQAEYGIIEKLIAAGQCIQTAAEQARDIYLYDQAWPLTSGPISISPGSSQTPAVNLSILGNVYWLTTFIYENLTSGLGYLSDKIKAVITADPNGYLSTNFQNIVDNLFLIETMDIQNRFAYDVIGDLLNLGNDTNDLKRNFGIYEDRKAYYSTIPTTPKYKHRLSDPAQRIIANKTMVYPWNVRPGEWLLVPDFLPGFIPPNTNTRSDPRLKFIDSVRYSAPYSLDLSGGKLDRLSQLLAKITYNGGFA